MLSFLDVNTTIKVLHKILYSKFDIKKHTGKNDHKVNILLIGTIQRL